MPKILIVDDEPVIRESLEIGLQSKGFETVTAADGDEAVTRALRNVPDLILLDVMMPKLDGMSVCKRLKALMGGFVPVIMLTALGSAEDKETGASQGADDYMVKPFKIEELITRINAMLRIKASHDEMRNTSITDFVTGMMNARYLQSRLLEECSRAGRTGGALSCLMFDLDNFKSINDWFGHQTGDRILKKVAGFLGEFVGKDDVAARYGGDEFVLVFPGMPAESATAMAEKIRKALEDKEFVDGDAKVRVTCSAGVCTFPGVNLTSAEDLIGAMDSMLYSSKKKGRNKVTVYQAG